MNNEIIDQDELNEGSDLYEHHRIAVDKGQSLLRIDKYLFNRLEGVSRTKIQNASQAGNILVNQIPVKANYKIKPGDIISVVLPHPPFEFLLIPQDIPVNIVYEDDELIVVDKEAGMVVHPGHGNYEGTLVNALLYHMKDAPLFQKGEIRPGLVHRIDKNTSGILVVAKTEFALNHLAKQFFDRTTKRRYEALVWGSFNETEGTIEGHIGRSLKDRMKMYVFADGSVGKPAITHYSVIEQLGYISHIECRLETGRTHQIRVHMEYIGHPIFNDERYGGDQILKGTTFTKYKQFVNNCFKELPRHALHAKTLAFIHPKTGKEMSFTSELPSDMKTVINKWRTYIQNRELEED
ncbi:MAG: RluA family pseudouridine synthase [Bacteroidota bacterium]|nr:MAG: RluA family pseudouridine synthase [Bacteroidota bacterium]